MQAELLNNIDKYFGEIINSTKYPDEIKQFRNKAYLEFQKIGLPHKKMEEWRFADIDFLNEIPFKIGLESSNDPNYENIILNKELINKYIISEKNEHTIVTVNGYFSPELSTIDTIEKEKPLIAEIISISEAYKKYPDIIKNHYQHYSSNLDNPFTLLNNAIFEDGLYIKFNNNSQSEHIFHIVHLIDVRHKAQMCNNRTIIQAEKMSTIKIIESFHNIGEYAGLCNSVTEINSEESSNIDYYKLQNESNSFYNISSTDVNLANNCDFHSATISLDGIFLKNNLNVNLDGENINANFHGFFFAINDNFIDNHTNVKHIKPNSLSNEVYKGIIDGKSSAVFNGKIYVAPDAQKTNAYQSNKNILLTDDASINSMPQLEIYADDVKCSHGSTTGYLDDESLFYLRSRGITESIARALLLNAFASDVFNKIKISSLCDRVKSITAQRLNIDENIYFCNF